MPSPAARRAALAANGHTVHLLDLYALGFRAAMSADERRAYHGEQPIIDPLVAEHAALVRACEALVFVYPTWWSAMPAILKGWLERVLVPGVGFDVRRQGQSRPRPAQRAPSGGHQHLRLAASLREGAQRQRATHGAAHAAAQHRPAHVVGAGWPSTRSTQPTRSGARHSCSASSEHWGRCEAPPRAAGVCPPAGGFAGGRRPRPGAGRVCAAGHEVRVTDLYAEGFVPELSAWEREHHLDPPADKYPTVPDIERHAGDLAWCDTLLLGVPHLVERPAGDAQGLDRQGVVVGRGVRTAPGQHPHPPAAAQRAPVGSGHHPRLVEVDQRGAGRGRQAGGVPRSARAVSSTGAQQVAGAVRHRPQHAPPARRVPLPASNAPCAACEGTAASR